MRLAGTVYCAHHPGWAFAAHSGAGAALNGGRFNRAGVPALYTSLRFETAWFEAQQAFPFKAQPMTLSGYDVDCDDVLDLTDPAVLAAHDIAPGALACAWKDDQSRGQTPPSWTVADRLIGRKIAGIIVPSDADRATAADINVVFWTWAATPPHQVRVIDDERRLPRNPTARPG